MKNISTSGRLAIIVHAGDLAMAALGIFTQKNGFSFTAGECLTRGGNPGNKMVQYQEKSTVAVI